MLDHLAAERAYYDAASGAWAETADQLAAQMAARVPASDLSVAVRRERFQYLRFWPRHGEYEQLWREPAGTHEAVEQTSPGSAAELLLDPATLLGQSSYIDVELTAVSPDEQLLAYSVDLTGEEVYELRFRDLNTGHDLADSVARTYYTGAWSADSATFFYTVHDDRYRSHEVWRHRVGTDAAEDVLVVAEPDEHFELEVRACRSGDVIEIASMSRDTTQVWLVDAHRPETPARVVEPRRTGVEYRVEHTRTRTGDRLFIVTNDGADEFRMMTASLARPSRDNWVQVLPEYPDERLYSATAFSGHLVTALRRDLHLMLRIYRVGDDGALVLPGLDIEAQVPVGSLELGENALYDAERLTVAEQSYTCPPVWYSVDLTSGNRIRLKQMPLPLADAADYVSELVAVPGDVDIPVTLVRRVGTPLDGTAPCLLYAYGAYESCFEPEFDPALTCLLDRGVVFAHAHVRGGGEGGRRWWLDGRMEHKQHTFTDHVRVARHLSDRVVDGSRIVTRGLSAGGLLQAVVFGQAPEQWCGVVAEVPFVDVVTTMLDPSLPLTVNEWDEWGDPRRAEDYAWMRAYSPYDNLPPAGGRPDLLVTGALHDPRVMVFEPAKWVAALRHTDPTWSPRCAFRVELGEGAHVGPSGRYAHLRYEAEVYAWVLSRFGGKDAPASAHD